MPRPSASFRVPTASDVAGALENRSTIPCPPPSDSVLRRTVLIVDDDDDTRALFVMAFEAEGYEVICANRIDEALEHLRNEAAVDVLITDYKLREGTGSALIHQATNEGILDPAKTPTVICTGYTHVASPPNVGVVYKSIDAKLLVRAVERALSDAGDEDGQDQPAGVGEGDETVG